MKSLVKILTLLVAIGRSNKGSEVLLVCCASVLLVLFGCTVTPRQVQDTGASFDGNERTSGFLGYTADGSGVITSNALARYNGLIDQFGKRYTPPLQHNAGVTPFTNGTFKIDAQHNVRAQEMNGWKKAQTP
jgi:hypothetical protein